MLFINLSMVTSTVDIFLFFEQFGERVKSSVEVEKERHTIALAVNKSPAVCILIPSL